MLALLGVGTRGILWLIVHWKGGKMRLLISGLDGEGGDSGFCEELLLIII